MITTIASPTIACAEGAQIMMEDFRMECIAPRTLIVKQGIHIMFILVDTCHASVNF